MTLDIKKIREMFWLFGMILPIEGDENKEVIKATFGHGLEEIIPDIMVLISQYAERNPEEFESYVEFIKEALDYMRGDRTDHPAVEGVSYEEYKTQMAIQLGRYTKSEVLKSQEKYKKMQEEAPKTELEKDR